MSVAGSASNLDMPVLQVEGLGYIQKLEHGLPVRRTGLREPRVEVVDEEPVLLTDVDMRTVVIGNLGLDVGDTERVTAACHYEVVVSGFGVGGGCGQQACIVNGRYSITPFRKTLAGTLSTSAIVVRDLTTASPILLSSEGERPIEMILRPEVGKDELRLHQDGAHPTELEMLIDIKRVGRGCSPALVSSTSA